MAATDVVARLLALADALPEGAGVTLDATGLRRLAGVEQQEETRGAALLVDLTTEDVGAQLGRSPSTIRAWCASGRIPGAYRLHAREWRVPPASLRRYLDAQADGAPKTEGPPPSRTVDLGGWRKHYRRRGGVR